MKKIKKKLELDNDINIQKKKYELENKLNEIHFETDKIKMNHQIGTLNLNNQLNKDLAKLNNELKLDKQTMNNQKEEELFKLDILKETQLMKQELESQQMIMMLKKMRANLENNNNQVN